MTNKAIFGFTHGENGTQLLSKILEIELHYKALMLYFLLDAVLVRLKCE